MILLTRLRCTITGCIFRVKFGLVLHITFYFVWKFCTYLSGNYTRQHTYCNLSQTSKQNILVTAFWARLQFLRNLLVSVLDREIKAALVKIHEHRHENAEENA